LTFGIFAGKTNKKIAMQETEDHSVVMIHDAGIMFDFFSDFFSENRRGVSADWLLIKNIYPIKKFSDKNIGLV
jgi:hypothetical protein